MAKILNSRETRDQQIRLVEEVIREQRDVEEFFYENFDQRHSEVVEWLEHSIRGELEGRGEESLVREESRDFHDNLTYFFRRAENSQDKDIIKNLPVIRFCRDLREAMMDQPLMWSSWLVTYKMG